EGCREPAGDLAETVSLLLPAPASGSDMSLPRWIEEAIIPLARFSEPQQRELLLQSWGQLTPQERLVFNKLVTGEFRIGVSQGLVIRALAAVSGLSVQVLAHRLTGFWEPTAEFFRGLLRPEASDTDLRRP